MCVEHSCFLVATPVIPRESPLEWSSGGGLRWVSGGLGVDLGLGYGPGTEPLGMGQSLVATRRPEEPCQVVSSL